MQGRCIGRLKFHTWSGSVVIVVLAVVLGETLVESQYYLTQNDQPQPGPSRSQYYFYDDQSFFPEGYVEQGRSLPSSGGDGPVVQKEEEQEAQQASRMFASRSGRRVEEEESDEEDDEEDDVRPSSSKMTASNGRPRPVKLPKGFNDRVNKRIKMSRKSKTRLHGDPDPIDDEDDEGRKPEGRLLWPFSIEITKGQKDKGGWGGPGGYGSYHEWLAHNGWGTNHGGWGGWGPISGPWGSWGEHGAGQHGKHPYGWKPGDLTDEEILNSKHYKKYRKKKKKKIKKLKKKLKFKRLVQKILQKHITYLDKIAPY